MSVAVGRRGYHMIPAESPRETGADGLQALPRLSSLLNVLPELRGGDCCLLHIRVSPSLDSLFRILRVYGIGMAVDDILAEVTLLHAVENVTHSR